MSLTKDQVIGLLREKGIEFTVHEHAAVMTVDAQTEALGSTPGVVVKNLFVKDKKNRLYIISAAPDTKVDLGVISARLGTGKGGVRFAPEEALGEVLQIAPGSVTPLAAANPAASKVVVLLDARLRGLPALFVHPLVNTASLGMSGDALGRSMEALGREAVWVDLEADPKIDRDNPPDLAKFTVEAEAKPAADAAAPQTSAAPPPPPKAKPASKGKGGAGKAGAGAAAVSTYEVHQTLTDVEKGRAAVLDLVAHALTGQPFAAAAGGLEAYTVHRLQADVEAALNTVKNAAFAMGYKAGKGEVVALATKQFA